MNCVCAQRRMIAVFAIVFSVSAEAGMPTVLPSHWTVEKTSDDAHVSESLSGSAAAVRIQAISFFVALFLLAAGVVKGLWNSARSDFPQLPILSYRRSLGLLTLWGLAFVVVLTMISGARELMTPGAWRKQGWTYQLTQQSTDDAASRTAARQQGLEELRTALWQFAATHNGSLPDSDEPSIDSELWKIPGWPGLNFMAVQNCRTETAGRVYVFEPDSEGDERLVLLTNGVIGSMRSSEISQQLALQEATP